MSIRLALAEAIDRSFSWLRLNAGLALFATLLVTFAAQFLFPGLFVLLTGQDDSIYINFWDWGTLGCIAGLSIIASTAVVMVPMLPFSQG